MKNWKTVAGFAGAGVVLSLFLGLVAGNPFGVMLLRMLLSGIGSGALGFGMGLVVERFLPELRSAGSGAGEGAGVNIVLPAENPHLPEGDAVERGTESSQAMEGVEGLGGAEILAAEFDGDTGEASGPRGLSDAGADVLEAEAAEVETLGGEEESAPSSERVVVPRSGRGRGGVDSLGGTSQDPETVARAVRTMLKRDQEG